jgi:Flp pilus assembly protein TadD
MRRNDEAEAATKFALSLAPDHSEALNNLGVVYSQDTATLQEAYDNFKKATDLNPNHESAFQNQAKVLTSMDRPEDAKKATKAHEALKRQQKRESY